MRQFDVYLNKRLTEAEVILHNLTYRDGLFIRTRMYLQSAINTLLLTKYMDYSSSATLSARADELLKEAYENFGTISFFNTNELTLLTDIEGAFSNEMKLLTLDILVTTTLIRAFSNRTNLTSAVSEYEVGKVLGNANFNAILSSDMIYDVQKEVQDWMDFAALLSSKVVLLKQTYADGSLETILSTTPFDIYWLVDFGDFSSSLVLSTESADYELHFVFSGASEMILSASTGDDWLVVKNIEISTVSKLLSVVGIILDKVIIPTTINSILSSAVSASLGRYRLCSDLDTLDVSEIDNTEMSTLDYVIITE